MDRSTTGSINCTFTATNDVGQTASATATANATRPPPPWVNGSFSPATIEVGQQSQLLYNSGNATVIGLVCDGLSFAAVQTPSMLLNQSWYWNYETWPDPGTQSCGISAHNSLGEVAVSYFDLVVAPVGSWAGAGGTSGMYSYNPDDPGAPAPTGPNSNSGKAQGYTDPNTGIVYSNPEMASLCGTCSTTAGLVTNSPINTPQSEPGAPEAGGYTNSGF